MCQARERTASHSQLERWTLVTYPSTGYIGQAGSSSNASDVVVRALLRTLAATSTVLTKVCVVSLRVSRQNGR
jgi:hypothetical protein